MGLASSHKSGGVGSRGGLDVRVSPGLLELLVCPVSHGGLRYISESQELISDKASLAYPICDGVPVMLVERARVLK